MSSDSPDEKDDVLASQGISTCSLVHGLRQVLNESKKKKCKCRDSKKLQYLILLPTELKLANTCHVLTTLGQLNGDGTLRQFLHVDSFPADKTGLRILIISTKPGYICVCV